MRHRAYRGNVRVDMKHGIGFGRSLNWGPGLLAFGVLACGRSGLLTDGSVEEDEQTSLGGMGGSSGSHRTAKGKGGTQTEGATTSTSVAGTTAIGSTSPSLQSFRWIVVPTKDAQRNTQLIGLRLGLMGVEDRQRFDDPRLASETKYGRFSPTGYYYAVTEGNGAEAERATRVVDFSTSPPTIRQLEPSKSGHPSQWGPWINDGQIIAYDAKSPSSANVENCRIVNVPDGSSEPIEFGIPGASCLGYFERSPKGWRLLAFASLGGARAIFSSHVDSSGRLRWVKVADLKANEALAQAAFNDDESYAVIQKVDTSTSALTNDSHSGSVQGHTGRTYSLRGARGIPRQLRQGRDGLAALLRAHDPCLREQSRSNANPSRRFGVGYGGGSHSQVLHVFLTRIHEWRSRALDLRL
ncbi:MAG: hypothetical protein QM784_18850 [Polyangiaceae bacterium]